MSLPIIRYELLHILNASNNDFDKFFTDDNDALSARPPAPARAPLVPERSDFLEGDAPAAAKFEAFPAQALAATGAEAPTTAGALIPSICDALLSIHSVKAYGRDLDF